MGNTVSAFAPNCRVFILVDDVMQDDYTTNPQKSFYKLNSIQSITSTISVDGGGSANIRLNDKDMKFRKYFPFKYLNTRTFGDEKIETKDEAVAVSDLEREPLPVALTNGQELEAYRSLLSKYGQEYDALKAMSILAKGRTVYGDEPEKHGGLLVPLFTSQNLIWIHYLGRDGYWYKKFSGIIVKVDDSDTSKKTPEINLQCRTYDRMLEYSQIITGSNNIGGLKNTEIPSLKNQKQTISSVNKYAGKAFNEIVVDVFRTTNQFFIQDRQVKGRDYRYFKVKNIFGFGDDIEEEKIEKEVKENLEIKIFGTNEVPDDIKKKLIGNWTYSRITGTYYLEDGTFIYNDNGKTEDEVLKTNNSKTTKTVLQDGEKGYHISDPRFKLKKYKYDEALSISDDFYPGSEVIRNNKKLITKEEKAWIQVLMADDFFGERKPFQNLVKTSLTLFNTEKQTPNDILKELKNIVLAYIYFDGDGTVKIERPYFDIDMSFIMNEKGVSVEEVPADYDRRYIISKKDISYKSCNFSEGESQIVTRVELQANPNFVSFDANVGKNLEGYSNSSFKTISKFGERFVTLKPIVSQGFRSSSQSEDILNSYCYAQKLLLTSDSKSMSFVLDQRPDLQLNRPLLHLDRGMVTLITGLTENFDFSKNTHTTNVKGKYTRFVGDQLINPWRKKIKRSDGEDASSSGWEITDWGNGVDPVDLSKPVNVLGVGMDILDQVGYNDNSETYESIKQSFNTAINSLNSSFNFEEEKITCLILRQNRSNVTDYDSGKQDVIYFIWKENGIEKYEKFVGCGGDPQTNESRWKQSSYGEYCKLASGVYRYNNASNINSDNKTSVLKMQCDDFNFVKLKKGSEGFKNSNEIFNSKNISKVSDINNQNQKLISFLCSKSVILYNTADGIEGNDKQICYDSLHVEIQSANEFISKIINTQTYLDVVVYNYNDVKNENPNTITSVGTDLNESDIRNVLLYIYAINHNNVDNTSNGIKLKENGIKYSDINPNTNDSGRRGMYMITQNFSGISDDKKWIDFINSKQVQDSWFSDYLEYIYKVINNDEVNVNNMSVKKRINLLIGKDNSDYLSVSISKNAGTKVYKNPSANLSQSLPDFPIDSVTNSLAGIIGLIHIGFTEAMLNSPESDFKSIYNNNFNTVIKYLSQYYLFNSWDESSFDISSYISTSKSTTIDSKTLKGNIAIWKFIKFMGIIKL